jgi:hypothetical protein
MNAELKEISGFFLKGQLKINLGEQFFNDITQLQEIPFKLEK